MPKNLNYPLASFQKAYALADAVNALGGSCTLENCAVKMHRKISGGFMVIVSSAQKFKLVSFEKGLITIKEEYKLIKHSYTNNERLELLRKAFLSPQVFALLYERFKGKELPAEMLDKILIREFSVEESTAGRVAGYFVDGLKTNGLLNGNTVLGADNKDIDVTEHSISKSEEKPVQPEEKNDNVIIRPEEPKPNASFSTLKSSSFQMQISGPGIDTKITIDDEEDLLLIEAMLKKIKKSLNKNSLLL